MNKQNLQLGFVLHRRSYRDTSLLIDLFTETTGRITVIAKGAKRPKSPLRHALQMFQPLYIDWVGKGELLTLRTAEINQPLPQIPAEYIAWGFYLNELLYRLLGKHEALPTLFTLYRNLLHKLTNKNVTEIDLRYFEKELLSNLGYGLSLEHDATSHEALQADSFYLFDPEFGLTLTRFSETNNKIFSGSHLLALANNELKNKEDCLSAKKLLRHAINHLLNYRPLKSREMII